MNIFNPRRNDRGSSEGIFRMEFPLMQWLVACLYKVFGSHLIISRLFMFFIGIFSIVGIYRLLFSLFGNTTLSLMGSWAFNFSPSFYYYTINPMPDNLALCLSIWGLALFFKWYKNSNRLTLFGSNALIGLAALCKLPFILFFIVPFVHFTTKLLKDRKKTNETMINASSMVFFIFPLSWYIWVIPSWNNNPIVEGMFNNNFSFTTLVDYYVHTFFSTFPELLINYGSLIFFFAGIYFVIIRRAFKDSRFILLLSLLFALLAYYFFEANAIAKTHDYYLFPFLPLIFILVAYGAYHLFNSNFRFGRSLSIFLLIILPLTCYLRMAQRWNPESPGFNVDLLDYKDDLRNAVANDALVVVGNDESHHIFLYYINKKGWGFHNNNLTPNQLKMMIDNGAKYLYTDSEYIYNNNNISNHLDQLILERSTIKVYSLKN